jgi:hypothetical protein
MTTKLDKPLKREVDINGVLYTVTFAPQGLKIVERGKRKGPELSWEELLRGSLTLANDLKDSIAVSTEEEEGA